MTESVRFKDFSLPPEPIVFRVAPDDFRCYPEIPLDAMMDIVVFATTATDGRDRMSQVLQLLSSVIVAEDWDKFLARTKRGTVEVPNPHPIGMRLVKDLLPWIMEVYGLRPSQESSESSDGSENDGTSSTAPVSQEESTS